MGYMRLDDGGAMSRAEFEAALAVAIAGELLTDTGADDALDEALLAVASSPPDSDARADAIEVARLVFAQLDPTTDDGIAWSGPSCPSCGTEMNVEIVRTKSGAKACQRCLECGVVRLVPDLFTM